MKSFDNHPLFLFGCRTSWSFMSFPSFLAFTLKGTWLILWVRISFCIRWGYELPIFLSFCLERDSAHSLNKDFLTIPFYLSPWEQLARHLFTWFGRVGRLWLSSSMIMVNHRWLLIWKTSLPPAWSSCIWMYDQVNWELPCPWVQNKVFSNRKETPTSKAQRG